MRRALLTLLLFAGVCAAIWLLNGRIESSFLPSEDKGEIMCNIELPQGASVDRTDAVLDEFLKKIADIKGIRSTMIISGKSMISGTGENVARVIIRLDPWDQRKTPDLQLDSILSQIQQKTEDIADARITSFTPPAIMASSADSSFDWHPEGPWDIRFSEGNFHSRFSTFRSPLRKNRDSSR